MPDVLPDRHRRLRRQPVPVDEAVLRRRIDGEVSHLERGQVLEEVRALRRRHAEVLEAALDDRPRAGDLVPGDRHAEPRIGRAPAADADEHVRDAVVEEPRVEPRDLLRRLAAVGAVEAVAVHDDEIVDPVDPAVAEHVGAAADRVGVLDVGEVELLPFVRQGERAHLQEAELRRPARAGAEVHRELQLHRPAHPLGADREQPVEQLGQREEAVLEDEGEADQPHAGARDPVVDGVVLGRVGRADGGQRPVLLGDVEVERRLAHLAVGVHPQTPLVELQRPELALRVLEHVVDRGELDDVPREARAEAQRGQAVHDRAPEAERDGDDAVGRGERRRGIEVVGAGHAGEVGIEAGPAARADDPLEDHRHLLLLQPVRRGPQVGLRVLGEGRGVDPLDRPLELFQPHRRVVVVVGQHVRFVHAGERLVLRILEQARRADGERVALLLDERREVGPRLLGERRGEDPPPQLVVVGAVHDEVAQVVLFEEAVEDVGADDDGRRHADVHAREAPGDVVVGEQPPHEGEAAGLAAERAAAEPVEAVAAVVRRAVEVAHRAAPLVLAVGGDRVDQVAAQLLEVGVVGDPPRPQPVGERELGPRPQPLREVVPLAVVPDALRRHRGQRLLQLAQVARPRDLRAVGKAEDEVAEAEVLDQRAPQLVHQRRRALEQERGAEPRGEGGVRRAGRLEDDRDVGDRRPRPPREFGAGGGGVDAVHRELDVGDDPEDAVLVAAEVVPRLLERAGEEHLRAGAHPQDLVRAVHPLRDQALRMAHQLGVDRRQERRVVEGVVLDDDQQRDAVFAAVVRGVELVLDVLDDRQQDPHVPLPDEDAVDVRHVVAGGELRQLARVVRQQHDRDVEADLPRLPRQLGGVHVPELDRRDDEVEARLLGGALQRLAAGGDAGQERRVPQPEVDELPQQPLAELPVLFEDEEVVGARDEKDVLDASPHQLLEIRDAVAAPAARAERLGHSFLRPG